MAYECNYLENVIWRVDYPINYSLRGGGPMEFQKELEPLFPKNEEGVQVTAKIQDDEDRPLEVQEATRIYKFLSLDEMRRVTLTPAFLGLDENEYEDYAAFRELVETVYSALNNHYSPAIFTRCGLRYINVFKLRTGDWFDWDDYISPLLLSHLEFRRNRGLLVDSHRMEFLVGEHKTVVRFGIHNPDIGEPASHRYFKLDIDCFSQEDTDPSQIMRCVDDLHALAEELFEEGIGPALRNVMNEGECNE